jgi:hypothetical protein
MPVGAAGDLPEGSAIIHEPVAISLPGKLREICTPLLFVIPAGLLAFDYRTSMWRAVFPDRSPSQRVDAGTDEQRSRRMLMEFGGTAG